jgi:Beta-glucan synthesis-associated protein SKN1/KRE6/Sbg1
MPIKNISSLECYKVGISFVLLVELWSFRQSYPVTHIRVGFGLHVSGRFLNIYWVFWNVVLPCCSVVFMTVWMLGNLARASYVGSSDFVWPYSFNKCDPRNRRSQEINACSRVNHYGLAPFTGRGSPEIDILESMQGEPGKLPSTFIQRPYQSTSLQVAPGIDIDRPTLGLRPEPVRFGINVIDPSNESTLTAVFS